MSGCRIPNCSDDAAIAAVVATVPTHTTVSGQPWGARSIPVLLDIGEDDGIPF